MCLLLSTAVSSPSPSPPCNLLAAFSPPPQHTLRPCTGVSQHHFPCVGPCPPPGQGMLLGTNVTRFQYFTKKNNTISTRTKQATARKDTDTTAHTRDRDPPTTWTHFAGVRSRVSGYAVGLCLARRAGVVDGDLRCSRQKTGHVYSKELSLRNQPLETQRDGLCPSFLETQTGWLARQFPREHMGLWKLSA